MSKDQLQSNSPESIHETRPHGEATSLLELLQRAATTSAGVTFYKTSPSDTEAGERLSYYQLLDQARHDAHWLQTSMPNLKRDTVFLLHFDTHEENIRWFWACTDRKSVV